VTAAPFPNPAVTVSALQISIMLYGLPRPDGMACGLWYFLSHSALLRVFPRLVCSGCCFPSLFLISPSDQTHPRLNEARGNILQDINFTVQGSNVKETTQAWNEARGNILQDTNFTVQGTNLNVKETTQAWNGSIILWKEWVNCAPASPLSRRSPILRPWRSCSYPWRSAFWLQCTFVSLSLPSYC